jgi:subtilase-type serine protease
MILMLYLFTSSVHQTTRWRIRMAIRTGLMVALLTATSCTASALAAVCAPTPDPYTKTGPDTCTIEPGSSFTMLTVEDGGLLLQSGTASSDILNITAAASANAAVTISGPGTRWNASLATVLGDSGGPDGVNSLIIKDGGILETGLMALGGTTGSNHVLVTGRDSQLSLTHTGSASLSVGSATASTLTVSNKARVVSADTIEIGEFGALNIGAAAGSAPTAPGTVSATGISFTGSAPTGSINFNHTDDNYVFDADIGTIDGIGAINQWAGGTVLTGLHAYDGPTNIHGGRLSVNGFLFSSSPTSVYGGQLIVNGTLDSDGLTVYDGGTLAGTGEVPPSLIKAGGTLAPGNPSGFLTVCCKLEFEPGSFLKIDIDAANGESDSVFVVGDAFLGGTVVPVFPGSGLTPEPQRYTILGADDSINGRFDGVDFPYAFWDATLDYDYAEKLVFLDIHRNSLRFADAAHTGNQRNVANAIESMPAQNPVYQEVLLQRKGQSPALFNMLSGEVHASTAAMLFNTSQHISKLPFAYLRNNLNAGMLPGAPLASAAADIPRAALPQSASLPLWADIVSSRQRLDGDDNAAASTARSHGVFIGGDTPIGAGWRLGAALGYMNSRGNVQDRSSSLDADSASMALYAGKSMAVDHGKINLLLGAAYTRHMVRSTRQVALDSGQQTLKADYTATAAQLFAELGYALPWGPGTIEPFITLMGSQLRTPAFSESGGWAALHNSGSRSTIGSASLGIRGHLPFELAKATAGLDASLAWRHASGDLRPQATMSFSEGSPYTVSGTPIARDAAVLGVGLGMQIGRRALLSLSYAGEFGRGATEHSGKLSMNWAF